MKRFKKNHLVLIIYCVLCLVIFLFLAELVLRIYGFKPWCPKLTEIIVTPGGKFFKKDPLLGYVHIPGSFKVSLSQTNHFNTIHHKDTLRITHPADTYCIDLDKEEIWIFGCSFTYGWLLNNNETFPWRLQEKMPDFEIVNFGVNGYGTLQALLQLEEALKEKRKPKVVVIAYASFHDERNIFSRGWRKALAPWNKLGIFFVPSARLKPDGTLEYKFVEVKYKEFPLMRHSSLAHLIEVIYNKFEEYLYRSHEVSKAVIRKISAICQDNGIELIVAGITTDAKTSDVLRYCKKEGIRAIDISVGPNNKDDVYFVSDGHPNMAANEQYAEKLHRYLTTKE